MPEIQHLVFFGTAMILFAVVALIAQRQDRTSSRMIRIIRGSGSPFQEPEKSWWQTFREELELDLQRAHLSIQPEQFLLVIGGMFVAGFMAAWMIFRHLSPGAQILLSALAALGVGYIGPRFYVRYLLQRRRRKLIEQLMDLLIQLDYSVAAGNTVLTAIQQAAEQMADPMREELEQVLRDARVQDLAYGLQQLDRRVNHPNLSLVISALSIQQETGGSARPIIRQAMEAITERNEVARALEVASTQGRLTAYILAALPFAFLLMFSASGPEFTEPLFASRIGTIALCIGGVLYMAGILWIRRMLDIRRIAGE